MILLIRSACKEVTISVGFDLFRLKKLNKRNFNDMMLNMISSSKQVIGKWKMITIIEISRKQQHGKLYICSFIRKLHISWTDDTHWEAADTCDLFVLVLQKWKILKLMQLAVENLTFWNSRTCVLCSSLIVGTKTGYRLYSLNSVDKLENIYESGEMNLLENF